MDKIERMLECRRRDAEYVGGESSGKEPQEAADRFKERLDVYKTLTEDEKDRYAGMLRRLID